MGKKSRSTFVAGPIVMVGNHEPLIFRRRTGYASAHEAERFALEHSEETVKGLAARGVTWVRTHFFKGFGLKAERDEIEMTRGFVEACHKHGIRVELYTQFGTLQYETFLAEEPEAVNWCVIDSDGRPVTISYGHHDFRYRPCATRDGYWEYLKRVIRLGVEHVRGDAFGFDNIELTDSPEFCHCEACRKGFVEFLKRKYRPDTREGAKRATERFGFAVLDHILPPRFNRQNPASTYRSIGNPVFQEWTEFRCESLRRRFEEIWREVKGLKPDMLIEYNVYQDFGSNAAWIRGVEMHRLGPWLEAFWNERAPLSPEFRSDGAFWHRVHGYKTGEALGALTFTSHGGRDAEQRRLAISECLAFNAGHPMLIGGTRQVAEGAAPEADALIAFRNRHPELYERTESAAQVGLVESALNLARNSVEPHYAEILAMGALLAGHIPFDLAMDLTPAVLSGYPVLVLPEVECMSDAEAQALTAYVHSGGRLVVIGGTSHYDEWRRRRDKPALAGMLCGLKRLERARTGGAGAKTDAPRGEFGKGRVIYLGRLDPRKPFAGGVGAYEISTSHWQLAKNWKQFISAVRWAGEGKLALDVSAPPFLAVEVRRAPGGRLIVHLVNYNLSRPAAGVSLALGDAEFREAQLWTPWQTKPRKLAVRKQAAAKKVVIGSVARYAVVELMAANRR